METWRPSYWLLGAIAAFAIIALTAASPLHNPSTSGADGDAFGVESAPGTACTATGTDAVCVGDGAVAGDAAGDNGVLAIGARSSAIGVDSIAIGENADATASGAIAIGGSTTDGSSADATGQSSVSLGQSSDASGFATIAIGSGANVSMNAAIGIGENATALAAEAIAIGRNTDATGVACIAVGGDNTDTDSADCSGAQSIALGHATLADQTGSVAIGDAAEAITGVASIAIGQNADATGANSIAIGGNATDDFSADATASYSIAIGSNSLTNSNHAIAIGTNSSGTSTNATAVGVNSQAAAGNASAFGSNASASVTNGIAIGNSATSATSVDTIAIGTNTDATGANCVAIGSNATDTDSADCSAADSVAIGQHILADDIGEFAFASGEFAVQSDAHTSIFVLRNSTTDATQTELFADGSAGDVSVPSDCTLSFRINVVARRTDADNESAAYFFEGAIDNNAGTTALVGTIGKTIVAEDTAAWDATVTADDTNDGINVLVTGEAAKTIRWVARAEITEVCG